MTDLGPMQPDYRRRMEAAEVALAEKSAEFVRMENAWRREVDNLRAGDPTGGRTALVHKDLFDSMQARAEAAEQRVKELQVRRGLPEHEKVLRDLWREAAEKGIDQGVDWPRIVLTLFDDVAAAEAREQALRDRVRELEAEREGFAAGWASQVTRAHGAEQQVAKALDLADEWEAHSSNHPDDSMDPLHAAQRLRSILLSPPTADTQPEDKP